MKGQLREHPHLDVAVIRSFRGLPERLHLKRRPYRSDKDDMAGIFYHIDLLSSALEASERGHRVVSQNIANVNTPGFKTKRLEFEKLLEQLHEQSAGGNQANELPITEVEGLPERVDGNNVNLEKEVAALKKNAMAFQAYSHLLASRVSTMRRAISS